MNINHYTYRVTWSAEDNEHVGLCAEFPSLSWLAPTPEKALSGIRRVVADAMAEPAGEVEDVDGALLPQRVELDGRILLIDVGLSFPSAEMPGIDLVLPDFEYLRSRFDDVEAAVLTHGHEDHAGGFNFLLRDVSFRIAPLTDKDADALLRGVRGYQLLQGYRGRPASDVEALREVLLRVSLIGQHVPEIVELDQADEVAQPLVQLLDQEAVEGDAGLEQPQVVGARQAGDAARADGDGVVFPRAVLEQRAFAGRSF